MFSFGSRTITDARAPDENTLFQVCSLTKPMTGVLLADAVLRGHVALGDPAQKYLPDEPLPQHRDGPILVDHLATYSSGLPWMPTNFRRKDEGGYGPEELHAFLRSFELPAAPGTHHQYGNVGFAVLGEVLERSEAMPLRTLFQERLFRPLGMLRSGFIGERANDSNRAQGIDEEGHAFPVDGDEPSQPAACAVETSAGDLMRFMRAQLEAPKDERLGAALGLARKPRFAGADAPKDRKIALGWFLSEDEKVLWKDGAMRAYRAAAVANIDERTAAVVMASDARVDVTTLALAILADAGRLSHPAPVPYVDRLPDGVTPYDELLGDGLRLIGIEAPREVTRGDKAVVRYFYRVEHAPAREWRSFVHADGKRERVRADHPLSTPMRLLEPNRIIEDRVELQVPTDLKSPQLVLFHGFFVNDRRMPLSGHPDDRFKGPTMGIRDR